MPTERNNPDLEWDVLGHEQAERDEVVHVFQPKPGPEGDKWDRAGQEARAGYGGQDSNTRYGPKGNSRRRNRDFQGFLTSEIFLAQMKPPDYVVVNLLLRGAAYTLTGNTGHAKTLIALLMAIRVACGDWFCGKKCRQGTVAFFAGENPENVRMQFYAMCCHLGVDAKSLPIVWHAGAVDLDQAKQKTLAALAAHPDLVLCIYDSLQAFFVGEDDNQNMAMLNAAIDFRELAETHPNRPASLILAHPVKNASRDNLLPRGGSALTNELDGNLTVWLEAEKNVATLHWHGKYRGVPFDPIKLELVMMKPEGLVDADGNQMPCTVIQPLGEMREAELARQTESRQQAILAVVNGNPKISLHEIAAAIGQGKTTAKRLVDSLIKAKWIRRSGTRLRLTNDGLAVLHEGQK